MIRYYKTLRGLIKAYGGQVRVSVFFDRKEIVWKNGKNVRLQPTKELQEKVAIAFAEEIYTRKSSKDNFVAILMSENCWLDWSLFQCFYVEQRKTESASAIPFRARHTTIASENSCEDANFLSGFAARLEQIIN